VHLECVTVVSEKRDGVREGVREKERESRACVRL
jgi:hypothetical protein